MSALIAWVGEDGHGPSASYIAVADEASPLAYASPNGPDLLGCCSVGPMWDPFRSVCEEVERVWRPYEAPRSRSFLLLRTLRAAPPPTSVTHVVHCGRAGENGTSRFVLWSATWRGRGWEVNPLDTPRTGLPVMVCGTDARALTHRVEQSPEGEGVFRTFCDFVSGRARPYVTRLVAAYRKGHAATLS